jgi:hypothetical protein
VGSGQARLHGRGEVREASGEAAGRGGRAGSSRGGASHRPDKHQLFDGGASRRNRWKWCSSKVRVDLGEMVLGSDKEPMK